LEKIGKKRKSRTLSIFYLLICTVIYLHSKSISIAGDQTADLKEPTYQNQASSIRDEVRHWQQFFLKFKVAQSEAHE